MDDIALSTSLAKTGLRLLGTVDATEPLIPPTLATFASSCTTEDGAFGEAVDLDDPRVREEANSEWYRLALRAGLFSGVDRRFLVAVNFADSGPHQWWWVRVELLDEWDIVGAGAASGILGNGPCRPSFVMLSLDGGIILRCDVGQASIDFSIVLEPHHAQTLLRHGEWMVVAPRVDELTRAQIRRWLGSHR
ncbi:hypothetical protein [Streptomyces sp. NBC_01451]|uniref:hypothetical protein n=1 Tax=Streptomyces sp. NBC_01451 TaxID=2903872 RepID=UPI002E2F7E8B|nr:hypothetical protein [Streptomyces sp. NBC_01451]